MLKEVQKNLHRWLCVLACLPVTISDQMQALTTSNRVAGYFERRAGMRRFVDNACDLAFSG
jgi:hypothetical protein